MTRAVALGSLALTTGQVPIIPHLSIGCPSLLLGKHSETGVDADMLARKASYGDGSGGLAGMLRDVVALGEVIAWPVIDLSLWILLRDDGSMSPGTRAEYEACGGLRDQEGLVCKYTWSDWGPHFQAAGLERLYAEASKPSATFPCWPGDPGTRLRITHSVARPISVEVSDE